MTNDDYPKILVVGRDSISQMPGNILRELSSSCIVIMCPNAEAIDLLNKRCKQLNVSPPTTRLIDLSSIL